MSEQNVERNLERKPEQGGITFREIFQMRCFQKVNVLTGKSVLNRVITGAHVVEIKESANWIRPGDLVFTSGVAFQNTEKDLNELIRGCEEAKASGLVVELGKYILSIGDETLNLAASMDVILLSISYEVSISEVIAQVYYHLYAQNEQSQNMESLMKQILYGDAEEAEEHLALYCYDPEKKHMGMVIGTDVCRERKLTEEESRALLRAARIIFTEQKGLLYLAEDTGVLLVAELEQKGNIHILMEHKRKDFQAYYRLSNPNAVVNFGVGNVFCGKEGIARSLSQAKQAFHMVNACKVKEGIRYYNELGIYRIFFSLPDDQVLRDLYHSILDDLILYDEKNHSELVPTLQIYLQEMGNITETAERMYVHRNTVKYRVKRIEEILGYDIHDFNSAFHLRLAYKIKKYLGDDLSTADKQSPKILSGMDIGFPMAK